MHLTDGGFAALIGLAGVAAALGLIGYAASAFFLMKLFAKAGIEEGWRAWVPVYNVMVFCKLGDLSPWLVLYGFGGAVLLSWAGIGGLFSLAVFAVAATAAYRIGLKLDKQPAWVALFVFLPVVWLGIAGLDASRWSATIPEAPWRDTPVLADTTTWPGIPGGQRIGGSPDASAA